MTEDKDDAPGKDSIHEEALECFKRCQDAEFDNRIAARDDLRFARLGEQWPQAVIDQRERDSRPCMTFNRMPTFIRSVVNNGRQNKPSIKVHPADDKADPATSEVINGLIRNIEYSSNADVAYDTGLDFAASCGIGYWRVGMEYSHDDTFDMDLEIQRIANPFSVYGDPDSTSADSSDWNCAFVVDAIGKDEFEAKYKNAEKVDWESGDYADMPDAWCEGEKIIVAEYWKRAEVKKTLLLLSDGRVVRKDWGDEQVIDMPPDMPPMTNIELLASVGVTVQNERETTSHKVTQYILNGAEVLSTNDWPGRYIPIVPVYGEEINIEGKRHFRSLIRDAKDAQRNYNYWRTTSTELVALAPKAPFIGAVGQFDTDADKWATANTSAHPYIEFDPVGGQPAPQRQGFAGVPAGALQEALNASDDMKSIIGIYDASLGARSNETSGRAINARKVESDNGTFHLIDNQARAIRHTGRILIDLIPHSHSKARVIRVMGEDKTPQTVPINQPLQPGQSQQGEDGAAQIYDLTVGKYDLTVDTGPGFQTRREEAAYGMTELMRAFPAGASVIGPHLAKAQDWPGADEIAEEFAALAPNAGGQNPQVQQMQQQLQQQGQQMQQMGQQLGDKSADRAIESRKLDIDAFNAETNRIKATAPAFDPGQVQALVMQTLQQALSSPDILPGPPPQGQPQPQQPQPPQGGFLMPPEGQQ